MTTIGYPTLGRARQELTPEVRAACLEREIEYVLTHSSSARHLDLAVAAGVLAGTRPRMSFAPMVLTTGNLMAFEVLRLAMGRPPRTDHRGYFFNPWTARIETPRHPLVALVVGAVVRRFMRRMVGARA